MLALKSPCIFACPLYMTRYYRPGGGWSVSESSIFVRRDTISICHDRLQSPAQLQPVFYTEITTSTHQQQHSGDIQLERAENTYVLFWYLEKYVAWEISNKTNKSWYENGRLLFHDYNVIVIITTEVPFNLSTIKFTYDYNQIWFMESRKTRRWE